MGIQLSLISERSVQLNTINATDALMSFIVKYLSQVCLSHKKKKKPCWFSIINVCVCFSVKHNHIHSVE